MQGTNSGRPGEESRQQSIGTDSGGLSTSTSTAELLEAARARETLRSLAEDSFPYRLLDAFLTHAPTAEGLGVIATDIIVASTEPDGLDRLAEFYKTGLLLPMRGGGRTPQFSFHPSRDQEIQSEANAIVVDLETAKRDPVTLRKYTLHRDGYRCVATHQWDVPSLSLPEVMAKFNRSTDYAASVEATHILPFSLMGADTKKALYKACTIWSVIKSFTKFEFKELSGDNINSLTNVISLASEAHQRFGPLDIWFEAVPGRANTYKIRKAQDYYLKDVREGTEVTFTSPNPEVYPLPNPHYLAFHAAVANVVHMAGIAEHLDDILLKYENIRVLSDEFGAEYLDGLLRITQRYTTAQ